MKYVVGIVPPPALEMVREALESAEIYRLTISEVEVAQPADEAPSGGICPRTSSLDCGE